jgi:hypothetical protein
MTRPKPRSFPTPKDRPSTTRYSSDPDTRSSSNDPPEFRGHQVRGSQWQDLPGDLHHGRNGWEEVGRIRLVSTSAETEVQKDIRVQKWRICNSVLTLFGW